MARSTKELTPSLTRMLRALRDLCDGPASDNLTPAARYEWLARVAAEAVTSNLRLQERLVHKHKAGRPISELAYYVGVTGAISAAASAGMLQAAPDAAPEAEPPVVDLNSCVLAVTICAHSLPATDDAARTEGS